MRIKYMRRYGYSDHVSVVAYWRDSIRVREVLITNEGMSRSVTESGRLTQQFKGALLHERLPDCMQLFVSDDEDD